MRCAACGEENREGALICSLCKTLFAGRPEAGRAREARPAAPPAATSGSVVLAVVGGLAAVLTAGAVYQRQTHKRAAVAATPAPAPAPAPARSAPPRAAV